MWSNPTLSIKAGPQERPRWQKHDWGLGCLIFFYFAFNKPYKVAALACLAASHEQEQAEAATEHLSLHRVTVIVCSSCFTLPQSQTHTHTRTHARTHTHPFHHGGNLCDKRHLNDILRVLMKRPSPHSEVGSTE